MQTFIVALSDGERWCTKQVSADFLRLDNQSLFPPTVKFYIKPHWYSFPRCVACFHWAIVSSITNAPVESDDSILKSWGVKP